ncbi:carboxypeptidase-like regulatory domain-containing protein [Subsaximicrobium wynnwilliamsii]|uniref:Carboxypeptidase-like regulatory domain-containing protein n=1 Tax=Subsaximicrobium wynnwilliamsii TaxID=291179 RepID=A0A5C6ZCW5_9FLAO|nr:carboxypeptidase-like regulatory domain-containing protein [Subsaximicrobium wynnwilliamsii]TXD81201.1 carboxypeptidase-like regulatory domain-containing protein [Subsaximicrobium wynnwilliamsii]TXD86919.1 carboxypeptidase-like regulatory domain-containing protein [Subsaximicrobium wynnwilliamsii]TXE00548.1 carboxypeptidase-like regulatory domain-containing protein [Subsaximicrobium wynnwilliamsii]
MAIVKNSYLVVILFLCGLVTSAQTITGLVLDHSNEQPLESVSIYYDGTTIGAVTNQEGYFTITSQIKTNAIVVVSYIGYETKYFSQTELANAKTIYLNEKAEALDPVIIEPDDWSRAKKLKYFRREFLGRGEAAEACKILNEDQIQLVYSKSKNTLYAYCDQPVQIKNKHLGYRLNYKIVDFEVRFVDNRSGLIFVQGVYFAGTSNFSELNPKRIKKRYRKTREEEYHGSLLEFMRALSQKKLKEYQFSTFIKSEGSRFFVPVDPYQYLIVQKQEGDLCKVTIKTDKLVVLNNQDAQSALLPVEGFDTFYIDAYGIHSPPDKLLFSGVFGNERMAKLLPLDYKVEE